MLEEGSFRGRGADFLYMLLLGATAITIIGPFVQVLLSLESHGVKQSKDSITMNLTRFTFWARHLHSCLCTSGEDEIQQSG